MRSKEAISIIACVLALVCGCTDEVSLMTQSQSVVYDNVGLGEGVDTRVEKGNKGTGQSCVIDTNTTFSDQPLYGSRMSSFYSNDTSTLYREIKANLGVDFEGKGSFSTAVDNSFQFVQDDKQSSVLLTFAATITTRTRGFDTPGEVHGGDFDCDRDGALDPKAFLNKCGTKYLAREDLGGFIMFSLRFDSLSKEQKIYFQNQSNVGIKGANVDFGATLNQLKNVLSETHEIFVWTHGFSTPPVKVATGDAITLQELLNFVSNLQPKNGTAVMRQVFENYHSYQFEACGVDPILLDGLDCSVDFYLNQEDIREDVSLKHRLDLLHHMNDYPNKYHFFGASESDVQQFLEDAKQCENAYANRVGICDVAMEKGEFDSLCKACEIPKIGDFGCEFHSLYDRADG